MSNIFEPGDVLFGKLRPYLAKVLWVDFSGFCTGELLVLSASKKLSPRYLKYRLLSNDFISIVDNSTFGAKMPRADWAFIGNLPTAFPEIDNQQKIAEYLDKKTGQIDLTIGCVERSIELLMEYRTSLIHSAVTGKILIS
jgi:restriction endonuclease S subunit